MLAFNEKWIKKEIGKKNEKQKSFFFHSPTKTRLNSMHEHSAHITSKEPKRQQQKSHHWCCSAPISIRVVPIEKKNYACNRIVKSKPSSIRTIWYNNSSPIQNSLLFSVVLLLFFECFVLGQKLNENRPKNKTHKNQNRVEKQRKSGWKHILRRKTKLTHTINDLNDLCTFSILFRFFSPLVIFFSFSFCPFIRSGCVFCSFFRIFVCYLNRSLCAFSFWTKKNAYNSNSTKYQLNLCIFQLLLATLALQLCSVLRYTCKYMPVHASVSTEHSPGIFVICIRITQ